MLIVVALCAALLKLAQRCLRPVVGVVVVAVAAVDDVAYVGGVCCRC